MVHCPGAHIKQTGHGSLFRVLLSVQHNDSVHGTHLQQNNGHHTSAITMQVKAKACEAEHLPAQSSPVRSHCSLADTHSLSSEEIGLPRQEDPGRIAASSLLTCKLEAERQYSALTP